MASVNYPNGIGDPSAPKGPPAAESYDVASRTIAVNDDGYCVAVHPVDQAVAFICGLQAGSIKSAPATGINYAVLDGIPARQLVSVLDGEVRRALASLIAAGDIAFDQVTIADTSVRGRIEWTGTYENLRLPRASRRQVKGLY